MTDINRITPRKFINICKHVKNRMKPSDSKRFDKETFFYAVYWLVCGELDKPVVFEHECGSRIDHFQKQLQALVNEQLREPFDAVQIANKIVDERFNVSYSKTV